MSNLDQNMQDLMNAAQLKLQAQQKQESSGENIYADMMSEMENEDYGECPVIQRQQVVNDDISIQYQPEPEDDYELDPDDEPVFENGPGMSQIDVWKKQFSKEKIFHTQILDKHFIFRTLNRFEYKQIVSIENIDALYREEIICKTCVLWPFNYDFKVMANEDSGYPSTLAQIIMENSGFTKEYGIEVL